MTSIAPRPAVASLDDIAAPRDRADVGLPRGDGARLLSELDDQIDLPWSAGGCVLATASIVRGESR